MFEWTCAWCQHLYGSLLPYILRTFSSAVIGIEVLSTKGFLFSLSAEVASCYAQPPVMYIQSFIIIIIFLLLFLLLLLLLLLLYCCCSIRFLGSKGSIKFVKVQEPSNCSKVSMCNFGKRALGLPPSKFPNCMFINNYRGKKGAGMRPCHYCRAEKGEP